MSLVENELAPKAKNMIHYEHRLSEVFSASATELA
jgi:hypothetical protein